MTDRLVMVGPFSIVDATRNEVIATIGRGAVRSGDGRYLSCALHVGGLNARTDRRYVDALNSVDHVYADGMAVVGLARMAGARNIERSATTDIGLPIVDAVGRDLGRQVRVALIGGYPGLAVAAATAIERHGHAVVYTSSGYHSDWEPILSRCRDAQPDITFVGLGSPLEVTWAVDHRERLPTGLIMTCGGWFGFLAGVERRAHGSLQKVGLEWAARLAQRPRHLARRYAVGILTVAALIPQQLWRLSRTRFVAATSGNSDGDGVG